MGSLPPNTKPEELRRLFEKYGVVTECDIMNRCGFVHMQTPEMADTAIKNLHNSQFNGANIVVERGRMKERKVMGGGPNARMNNAGGGPNRNGANRNDGPPNRQGPNMGRGPNQGQMGGQMGGFRGKDKQFKTRIIANEMKRKDGGKGNTETLDVEFQCLCSDLVCTHFRFYNFHFTDRSFCHQ